MTKKFFRDAAVYALTPQLPRLLNIALLPLITPHLTPQDYGIFGLLVAYVGLIEGVKDLGLSMIATNAYFKHPKRYMFVWSRLYSFLSVWSGVLLVLMLPVVYVIVPAADRSLTTFLPLAAAFLLPSVVFSTANSFGVSYLQFQQRPGPIAAVSVVAGIASAAATYVFIALMDAGYKGFIYSALIASLITYGFYQNVLRRELGLRFQTNFTLRWIGRKLQTALPTVPHYYTNYLLTFSDRVLLHWYGVPLGQIGLYSFAYNLGNNFSVVGKSVGKAATPVYMSAYKAGRNSHVADLTNLLQVGFIVLAVLSCVWMREIFAMLARQGELAQAYYLAIPVVFANSIYPLYFAAISLLRYHEHTRVFWKVTAIACAASVAMNALLIPLWGIEAAAFVTLISYAYMGFSGFFIEQFRRHNTVRFHEMAWLAMLAIAFGLSWYLRDANPTAKLALSATCMLVLARAVARYRQQEKSP